jgi:hypothetical protein
VPTVTEASEPASTPASSRERKIASAGAEVDGCLATTSRPVVVEHDQVGERSPGVDPGVSAAQLVSGAARRTAAASTAEEPLASDRRSRALALGLRTPGAPEEVGRKPAGDGGVRAAPVELSVRHSPTSAL